MRATMLPWSTGSPSFSASRSRRPSAGLATTYRSRTRVLPSSSTVTRRGPCETTATSTGIGRGRRAIQAAPAAIAIPISVAIILVVTDRMSLPRLQHLDEVEAVEPSADDQAAQDPGGDHDDQR